MALGSSSSLGYLECGVWGERATKVHKNIITSEQEDFAAFGGTIKFEGAIEGTLGAGTLKLDGTNTSKALTRVGSKGYVKEEPPIQPLEWTLAPVREVQKEGNTRCRVSKSAVPTTRDGNKNIHLVQTTRIEPRRSSRASSRASSRPSSGVKAREEIVVTEADFRRCDKRLTLLRGCQLPKMPLKTGEEEHKRNEFELSFKSAFRKKCGSADDFILDPWKGLNPEQIRLPSEGDMILNQVWVADNKEEKVEDDDSPSCLSDRSHDSTSTRASSADLVTSSWPLAQVRTSKSDRHALHAEKTRYPRENRTRHAMRAEETADPREFRAQRRARSQSSLTTNAPSGAPTGRGGWLRASETEEKYAHEGRSRSHASGCPKAGSADAFLNANTSEKYKNRIQPIGSDDNEEVVESEWIGVSAIRKAARLQRRFEKQLGEEHSKPEALWLSLDPLSGQVVSFGRAAATRLEDAYVNHRSNVPLAGLGGDLENDMVHLASDGRSVQESCNGDQMDVRRIQVRSSTCQVSINVAYDNEWRIADVAVPGQTEERLVLLHGASTVRPPTPPLPPLDPDRRLNFVNAGADIWGY